MGCRLGDIDDRHVEELHEPLLAVLAETGLDDGVEISDMGDNGVHDADRRHVGLDVALDRVGSETRRELDDLGAGPCDDARRLGDGAGHRTGGVHVDCEDLHGLALLTHEPVSGTAPLQTLDL